jgi:hypothetical protein
MNLLIDCHNILQNEKISGGRRRRIWDGRRTQIEDRRTPRWRIWDGRRTRIEDRRTPRWRGGQRRTRI